MLKWVLLIIIILPMVAAEVEVQCSLDGNVTWRNATAIYQDENDALQAGLDQATNYCCRARNETTEWGYACATTKEGLDMLMWVLLAVIPIILFGIGMSIKDWVVTIMGGFAFLAIGVYVIATGLPILTSFLNWVIGVIYLGVGAYITIKAGHDHMIEVT
jgi:hypothetical protein